MNMLLCRHEQISRSDNGLLQCCVKDSRRVEHIRNILKLKKDDACKVGIFNGGCCDGRIAAMSKDEVLIEFDDSKQEAPPAKMPLTLFIAMQRPNTFKKVIHCAVTMGVERICFFGSYKVEKSYWQSSVLLEENLNYELELALEQCKDTIAPEISFCRYFKNFTEDVLSPFLSENPVFIAHPDGRNNTVPQVMQAANAAKCALMVGPEGGFTDHEVSKLQEMGLDLLSLGDRVLRTEFALAALLEIFNLYFSCENGI